MRQHTCMANFWTSLLIVLSSLSGCGGGDPGWDLARTAATNVEPDVGVYSFGATGCLDVALESASVRSFCDFQPTASDTTPSRSNREYSITSMAALWNKLPDRQLRN